MARLGAFDRGLRPLALFDSTAVPEGWFSDDLIGAGAVTGLADVTLPAHKGALGDAFRPTGAVLVQAAASVTLSLLTAVAAGTVLVQGAAAVTLPVHTSSAASTVPVAGAAAGNLPALTSSAAGVVEVQGAATITLSILTSTAAGTSGGATGRVTQLAQLVSYVPTPAGRFTQIAVLYSVPYVRKRGHIIIARKLSGVSVALPVGGAEITLPVHIAAATGTSGATAGAAVTLPVHTAIATGTSGGAAGAVADITLPIHKRALGDVNRPAGTVLVQGAAAVSLSTHTVAATGVAGGAGAVAAITLPVHVAAATGTSGAVAGAAVTLPPHTTVATGAVAVAGVAARTLPKHTVVASGTSGGTPSLFFYVAELPRTKVQRPPNVSYAFTVTASNRATLQAEIDAYANRVGHTKIVCTNGGVAAGLTTFKKNTTGAYRCSIWSQGFDTGYFTDDKRYNVVADQGACFTMRATVGGSNAGASSLGAHDYDFGGIIFDVDPALSTDINDLINLNSGGYAQDVANIAHRFYWRHCFWRDRGLMVGKMRYMMRWDCTDTGIFDSVFGSNYQVGAESKNILVITSEGKQRVYNTTISGGAIGILWGGAPPAITNLVTADVVVDRCFFTLPWSWNKWATLANNPRGAWDGVTGRALKNRLEFKSAERVLVEDIMLEHSWVDGQTGFLYTAKSTNDGGGAPDVGSRDHTYRNIWGRRGGVGLNVQRGSDPNPITYPTARMVFENVLLTEILGLSGLYGGGKGHSIEYTTSSATPSEDAQFRHVTGLGDRVAMLFPTCSQDRLRTVIDECILQRGQYGIRSDTPPCLEGTDSLNTTNPGYTFDKTLVIGAPAATYPPTGLYPATTAAVGFVNYATGSIAETVADIAGMALAPTSPYKAIGAGGVDPGCDTDELMTRLSHIMDGDWT